MDPFNNSRIPVKQQNTIPLEEETSAKQYKYFVENLKSEQANCLTNITQNKKTGHIQMSEFLVS